MKNLFKFGFLALALSLGVVACHSEKKTEAADSTAVDTAATMATADTAKVDTTAKADTAAKAKADTAKKAVKK